MASRHESYFSRDLTQSHARDGVLSGDTRSPSRFPFYPFTNLASPRFVRREWRSPFTLVFSPRKTWLRQDFRYGQVAAPGPIFVFPLQSWRSQHSQDGKGSFPSPSRLWSLYELGCAKIRKTARERPLSPLLLLSSRFRESGVGAVVSFLFSAFAGMPLPREPCSRKVL